ncbi:MAG: nucleoside-diphosphate sugar epimerase/dehydratase [Clostridia bacterium]|nr:nucleoside-diphosphate sugar epimerase/dehydratase [Clostridia bacterium]
MERVLDVLRRARRVILPVFDALILAFAFAGVAFACGMHLAHGWGEIVLAYVICSAFIVALTTAFSTNRHMWRFAGAKEYLTLINVYAVGYICYFLLNKFVLDRGISEARVLLAVCVALLGSLYARVFYRWFTVKRKRKAAVGGGRLLAIIGAGSAGVALQEQITRNPDSPYVVWGFFDDDPRKEGLFINGFKVHGPISAIKGAVEHYRIAEAVLAIPSMDIERRREIVKLFAPLPCRLRIMPDTMSIEYSAENHMERSIRDVRIEDLLGRTSIQFDREELDAFVRGKTILVSGGGGSIGSEIARQIVRAGARRLVIFDINENDSYMLYRELLPILDGNCRVCIEIGSMTDKLRVQRLFSKHRPDVVFHAAAHKHVPLMEDCPYEAVCNNIFGTYNLLAEAERTRCTKFVLISTDKAVNPTNIMGATKRYCEEMLRAFASSSGGGTDFVSVRFGNVLGSHGSVIPLFQMQIAQGGPVTITDKRMTRYFMTIPEAAGLVIKAGAMAKCSETFILDMGDPVKIADLAENLIRLSGFEPHREIAIVETGLRPGEKLYEELLVHDATHVATADSKIFIERNDTQASLDEIEHQLKELGEAAAAADDEAIRALMRRFVPSFRSPAEVNGAVVNGEARAASEGVAYAGATAAETAMAAAEKA